MCVWQVDRLLEGMGIWQQEQEELSEHQQLCEAAGKKVHHYYH